MVRRLVRWVAVLTVCAVAAYGSVAPAIDDAREGGGGVFFDVGSSGRSFTHCNDLANRRDARRFLESLAGNHGVQKRLDPDRDGKPCEGEFDY
jgi:hypothetical protein